MKNNKKSTKKPVQKLSLMQLRIKQVQEVLTQVLKFKFPADAVLSKWFREHKSLGGRDRAQVAEAVFDILRHLRLYRQLAQSGQGSEYRRLALLGLCNTLGQSMVEEAFEPGEKDWLKHTQTIDLDLLPFAVRHSLPDWLIEPLQALPNAESLVQTLNQKAPLDLRVNPLKLNREQALQALAQEPYNLSDATATPFSPWGIRIHHKPALHRWPLFEEGKIEVQDEGSQILCLLVSPKRSDLVIDFCAGAGGKTLLLGAMMNSAGRLYAFDVSEKRLQSAKPRLARSGLSNVTPVLLSHENDTKVKRLAGKAQRVLVDAPCSGLGTLRRNPDLKWRQTPQSLEELLPLQQRILRSASRCVAKGGRLIYSTCSLLPQENQDQITTFLADHPQFKVVDAQTVLGDRVTGLQSEDGFLKLRPDIHGTDGFFAAVLERVE